MILDAAFHRRVLHVYEDMLDQPRDARAAWLERACAGAPGLRESVEALVAAQAMASMLPTAPPDRAAAGPCAEPCEETPLRIGPYRLLRVLGAGGMGIVHEAERVDGLFDHRVAIKLMRTTVLSARAQERLEAERRILARLRHPHVAQIFDGGTTGDGRPYIVMELIDGLPITDHCAVHRVDLAGRLRLFDEMIAAVDHAHRQLVVHADLAPANVVVAEGYGVKLLDFGIACLLDCNEAESAGGMLGHTPGYASPARRAGLPPVPADDIFSAGRLLDVLTDGVAGVDAALRAIVARAACADPERRYASLRDLADDLRHWRQHRPTQAAAPGRVRRGLLFARRHRLALSLGGVAGAVAIGAFALITTLYVESRQRLTLAEARAAATRHFAAYIIDEVDPALARTYGTLALRRDLVGQTAAYLRGLEQGGIGQDTQAGPARTDPALALDIAGGYLRIARIYGLDPSGGIGDLGAARASLAHAEALIDAASASGGDPARILLLRGRAGLLRGSEVYLAPSRAAAEASIGVLSAAAASFRAYLAGHPGDAEARLGLWSAEALPERAYTYLDRPLDGVAAVGAHLPDATMPVHSPAQRAERDFNVNGSLLLLGEAYADSDPQRAVGYLSQMIAHVDEAQARGLSDWESDLTQASALADRAELRDGLGAPAAAVEDLGRAVTALSRLYLVEGNHEVGAYLAHIRAHLADALSRLGRHDAARTSSDAAIAWLGADAAASPGDASRARTLALALSARAVLEERAGDRDRTCAAASRAAASWANLQSGRGAMPIDLTPASAPMPRNVAIVARNCGPI